MESRATSDVSIRSSEVSRGTSLSRISSIAFNKPLAYTNALVSLLKSGLGLGFLSLPYYVHEASIVWALILSSFFGFLSLYCLHILIRTQIKIARKDARQRTRYPEALERSIVTGPPASSFLSKYARRMVSSLIIIYQLIVCSIFVNYMSFKAVEGIRSVSTLREVIEVLLMVSLFFLTFVRKMAHILPLSFTGNVLVVVATALLYIHIATDDDEVFILDKVIYKNTFSGMTMFIGHFIWALPSIGVIVVLEEKVSNPVQFIKTFGLLNVAYLILSIFYLFMGASAPFSLAARPDRLDPSVEEEGFRLFVRILYSLIIWFSYPLQFHVSIEVIWMYYLKRRIPRTGTNTGYGNNQAFIYSDMILRCFLIIVTVIISLFVPYLKEVCPIISPIIPSLLGLVLPAYMEFNYYWSEQEGQFNYIMVIDVIIIVIGLFCIPIGFYNAVYLGPRLFYVSNIDSTAV